MRELFKNLPAGTSLEQFPPKMSDVLLWSVAVESNRRSTVISPPPRGVPNTVDPRHREFATGNASLAASPASARHPTTHWKTRLRHRADKARPLAMPRPKHLAFA